MNLDIKKYRIGRFGMSIIKEEPIPDVDNLEWDSSDIDGDSIPLTENCRKDDAPLWWTIIVDGVYTSGHYIEMITWCEENTGYMCGIRVDIVEQFVVGYFRHPDDALAFKWRWV